MEQNRTNKQTNKQKAAKGDRTQQVGVEGAQNQAEAENKGGVVDLGMLVCREFSEIAPLR